MSRSSSGRDFRWLMLVIASLILVLDRWSKRMVEARVPLGRHVAVIPKVFWISHVLNTGAAFSIFEGAHSAVLVRNFLIGFSIVAIAIVSAVLWRVGRGFSATAVALALILGGALGNVYDRIQFHHVIDFLEVHIGNYHWPDFNVADSAIVVGACLLLLEMFRTENASA